MEEKNNVTENTTVETTNNNSKFYTVFNYRMAKYLLNHNCTIADISLNKKVKGIVFHFYNTENLRKLIELKKEIIKLQRETRDIKNNPTVTVQECISQNEENTQAEFPVLPINHG